MACCAIAVFILSQIYVAAAALRTFLFGASAKPAAVLQAAAWRLGPVDEPVVAYAVSAAGAGAGGETSGLLRLSGRRLTVAVLLAVASLTVAVTWREDALLVGDVIVTARDICGWLPAAAR